MELDLILEYFLFFPLPFYFSVLILVSAYRFRTGRSMAAGGYLAKFFAGLIFIIVFVFINAYGGFNLDQAWLIHNKLECQKLGGIYSSGDSISGCFDTSGSVGAFTALEDRPGLRSINLFSRLSINLISAICALSVAAFFCKLIVVTANRWKSRPSEKIF